ncbi:MAG TPA: OmpA family protein [Polyangiaceae bacterium]|nr:OmpA family protein [Polyangiaceae bacterium]
MIAGLSISVCVPSRARAAEAGFSLQASESGASATGSTSGGGDGDFWRLYRPTPMALELGFYGGVAIFSAQHNLQDLEVIAQEPPAQGHQKLGPGLDLGLRAGFYPSSWLGVEGELGLIPTSTGGNDESATIWTYRGSLVGQYPEYRLVPFVLAGAGGMNLKSSQSGLGDDSDPALHFGLGAKFAITQDFTARLDFRDNLMQENRINPVTEDGDLVQNFEVLLGVSFTLGRTGDEAPAPPPADSDGDGFADSSDACPSQPGVAPNGCPAPVAAAPVDTDEDGIVDPNDPCPSEPEDGAQPAPTDGCPNKDPDADGILAPADKCPIEKGVAPDGCAIKDKDGDGVLDEVDKCPDQPETKNGFQDADGCPDELPKEVAKFAGVIKGIQFDFGKATIRQESNKTLDEAVKVLKQYQDLRIMISGHTDNVGEPAKNVELSQQRAAAVKEYMVGKGVEASRIETRGAGPNEPVADNATDKGRQENRRIEFKLLQK